MAALRLRLFGAFQVTLADRSTARFESDKARALLAYLAVEAGRPHRRAALVGLLWPDEPEGTARHNLRQTLYSLRQTLGDTTADPPYLRITRDEIQFNAASDAELDSAAFDLQLAATTSHAHSHLDSCAVCAPRLQGAADLYGGDFLEGFFLEDSAEFEEWALARREGFRQRALDALSDLASYNEQHGDLGAARRCAARQLELDPWREQAHRQMMRVLVLEGRRAEAIAQYETCRRVLAEELGVEPSGETRELYERIVAGTWEPEAGGQGRPAGRGADLQPAISDRRPAIPGLPAQLTSFIGREREMAELGGLIGEPACRCITLVGPGGIGKTRLALQAASMHRGEFAQGVAFVPLVTVDSADAVVPAVAEALGFSFYGPATPRVQLSKHLRDKEMLLVLDNVEQLLARDSPRGNAAELFVELLQGAAGVKLLVTSREPLNVQGEWVYEVEGLQNPLDDQPEAIESSASVSLFLQRAQRARVGFVLSTEERPSVARLCRLVGGMPLALELAATWVRALSVAEIVQEIERSMDFLSTTVRDLPQRHRSIRAVFDHSWNMLTAEEQRVLRDLSAFQGRFRRQAAEQVAGASLATLSALVAKSLLHRTGTGHYGLHELVRQYAAAKLAADGLAPAVAERHSRYYLEWLGRCAEALRDSRQKETAGELMAEVDDLRAAWDWALAHDETARAYHVSTALLYLFELRTWFAVGEVVFRNAAETIQSRTTEAMPSDETLLAITAMRAHSGYFGFRLGKSAAAYATLLPSARFLQSSKDQVAGTYALWYLGMVCWEVGKFEEAEEALQAGLEMARACGARWYETMIGEYIGIVAHDEGEYNRARRHLTEALALAREMGDPMVISHVLGYLSLTTLALGETAETERVLRESLALAQEIGYRSGIGNALDRLGLLAQLTSAAEARPLFTASYDVFRENGDLRNVSRVLNHLGYNSLALGDAADAQRRFAEVLRLAREGGYVPFALDALAGLATLWAGDRDDRRPFEFVLHVLQHPAAAHDVKARAERLRAELASRLTPEQVRAARAEVRRESLEQVLSRVLGQFSSQGASPP